MSLRTVTVMLLLCVPHSVSAASVVAKRAPPPYDGRRPPSPTALEALIWVPRAVLYPPHLVAEYVLRRPIVAVVQWGDDHYLWRRIHDLVTWDGGRSGIYPTAAIELGLKQTIGLALFSRQWPDRHNSLKVSTSFSTGVLSATAIDRYQIFRDGTGAVYVGAEFVKRPDGVFYGIGGDTRTSDQTFFSYRRRGISLGVDGNLGGLNRAVVELAYRDSDFGGSDNSTTVPSIDARYGGPDQPPLPPGFEGYRLVQPRVALMLDSRNPLMITSGTGARLELRGAYAVEPGDTSLQFASWAVTGVGYYDFSGVGHVVALEIGTSFVERIGSTPVPFTELATLGGVQNMQGFFAGRLRGDSAITATVEYRYPFWTLLDAEIFSGVGNTFAGHLAGLGRDRLFGSYGVALKTNFSRDTSLGATLAFASTRFDAPDFRLLDTTRFFLGVNHDF